MQEKKDEYTPSEKIETTAEEEHKDRQKEAAEAAEFTQSMRDELETGEVGVAHPHEEKDTSYMDEKPPKLTVFKILRYFAIGVILFVFILMLYRIHTQKKDYADYFVWTERAVAKYEETKNLTVWTQDMSSLTFTLARDENNIPTETYEYKYSPYSTREQFDGCFMVSDPMYVEETEQFIITFRVNRTAGARLKEQYTLADEPKGDVYFFLLSDGITDYTDYEYVTFEKDTYFYYRLVFNDVPYSYVKSHIGVTEDDIVEMSLSVYYKELYHMASPVDTLTVANNLIQGDAFKIKDALPAELTPDIKQWVASKDE